MSKLVKNKAEMLRALCDAIAMVERDDVTALAIIVVEDGAAGAIHCGSKRKVADGIDMLRDALGEDRKTEIFPAVTCISRVMRAQPG